MTVSVGGVSVWRDGDRLGLSGSPSPSLTVEDARILAGAVHVLADEAERERQAKRDRESLEERVGMGMALMGELRDLIVPTVSPAVRAAALEEDEPEPPRAE